ncbi:MAG: metallophosphoesterase family protein [Candidatus Bathyarchaeota archaeon]|nr:metallophosphoesterase family protein [Candidatus Bathyarchaeota archaeon]MDH5733201.1 metallophosphoesterase family protein [Candidatus Bathyarchaeota archaeon]
MKIQVLSDLHIEFEYYTVKVVEETDVLVMAGDFTVAKYLREIEAFARLIKKPIVYVAGNHDYYYGVFNRVNETLEQLDCDISNFHFLNNGRVEIEDVRFIGSTLWSNFDLAPNPGEFAYLARSMISDFMVIKKSSTSTFSPFDCSRLNEESRRFLKQEVDAPFNGRKVVVTHFLPSPKSVHPKFEGASLNPYFCCNCENLMGQSIPLWIHGHTHESTDYNHKGTRVIANPKGYFNENTTFNEKLIVEI